METKTTEQAPNWIITAKRSNGETLFLVHSYTQGLKMVPNAQSMAERFTLKQAAREAIEQLETQWAGLKFSIELVTIA